jgi:RimJ/RimL family protein N-acetyltransferase
VLRPHRNFRPGTRWPVTGDHGYGTQAGGLGWARARAAGPAGTIRWAAPGHRLADDRVGLRLPELADAAALHRYAARPGGLDGSWVPLPGDVSLEDCRALVRDWLAGWGNQRSFYGPALIITAAGDPALAGMVGLGDRGGGAIELAYGVAPDRRGRGYATRAARLAARWLLHEGRASMVELRIGSASTASQRVAVAAGFTLARAVRPHVPAAGKADDQLRFVMRRRQ